MAFTLVIVSFSCTGPIIGTLLVEAAGKSLLAPAMGMLGFAIALALPFSLFAMFPSVLKKLPKSGGWMNTFKVTLAFLELALALKFLSVADLAYGWHILDREVFVSLWIIIFSMRTIAKPVLHASSWQLFQSPLQCTWYQVYGAHHCVQSLLSHHQCPLKTG